MLKLIKYLKPYLWQLAAVIALTYVQVMATLRLPDYTAQIVNEGIVQGDNSFILHTGAIMLLVSLLGGASMIGAGYFAARLAAGFSQDLRNKIFSKVESFSLVEFNKFSTASLITRSTNDIQQIQMVILMLLRLALMAPIMGIGAVVKAYQLAPHMTWIMAISVGTIFIIVSVLFVLAVPKFKILQTMIDRLNLITREILTGLRVIRAFNNEKYEENKFDKTNTDLTKINLFINRLMVILQPVMILILNLTALGIVWVGSHYISTNNLAIGNMLAFLQYAMQVIMSFLFLTIIFIMVPRASVSGDRVAEVINQDLSIKNPEKPQKTKTNIGDIEFKNVFFSYPEADIPVLEDINFKAESGQTTAIVGGTGSGKSTIINLIPRFYDATKGEILIDGANVKNIKQEELHQKIGYIPQKAVLFSGSLEENIKYGAPNTTIKDIRHAAKIAQADEFINSLPQKYQTPVAQGGKNFSGGQKQRISIARALVKKPEIYIFDDSFSALDFKTDSILRKELKKETKNKTVIIIAQRISTIINAEKIIVLDEGKIVATGNHKNLMKTCQIYREIALSQLSEEELNK